jgi:ATP-dependent protease HslVU (ClpYQ) peptidase subunit
VDHGAREPIGRQIQRSPGREITAEAMGIAASLCAYTNDQITVEEL